LNEGIGAIASFKRLLHCGTIVREPRFQLTDWADAGPEEEI
jgi:hypothetical protein